MHQFEIHAGEERSVLFVFSVFSVVFGLSPGYIASEDPRLHRKHGIKAEQEWAIFKLMQHLVARTLSNLIYLTTENGEAALQFCESCPQHFASAGSRQVCRCS